MIELRSRFSAIAGVLSRDGFGEVAKDDIPETLVCPQCGTDATDGGECLVRFEYRENTNPVEELRKRAPLLLTVVADCRTCGYYGPGPTHVFLG